MHRSSDVEQWGTGNPKGTGTVSKEEMAQMWLPRGQGYLPESPVCQAGESRLYLKGSEELLKVFRQRQGQICLCDSSAAM